MLLEKTLLFILIFLHSFALSEAKEVIAFSLQRNQTSAFFHEGTTEKINRLTKEIKKNRKNADLYFERAILYHGHSEFKHARNDYNKVIKLGSKNPDIYYFLARLFNENNKYVVALKNIDIFLKLQSESVSGMVERARILSHMENYTAAIVEYDKVLKLKNDLIPEYYLEATDVILNQDSTAYDEAIQLLENAIAELGALSVFLDRTIDLELRKGDVVAALAKLDAQAENLDRKENHYAKKADILLAAGQTESAMEYYRKALEAIEILPSHRQVTPSVVELKERVITSINKLNH